MCACFVCVCVFVRARFELTPTVRVCVCVLSVIALLLELFGYSTLIYNESCQFSYFPVKSGLKLHRIQLLL